MPDIDIVNLTQKLSLFSDTWSPKLVGTMDDYHIKLAKIDGDFVWHAHDNEDELFLVIDGRFRMDIREADQTVTQKWIEKGEMIIIPKGVEHKPYAPNECSVLLIEHGGVDHTGGVQDTRRIDSPEII